MAKTDTEEIKLMTSDGVVYQQGQQRLIITPEPPPKKGADAGSEKDNYAINQKHH